MYIRDSVYVINTCIVWVFFLLTLWRETLPVWHKTHIYVLSSGRRFNKEIERFSDMKIKIFMKFKPCLPPITIQSVTTRVNFFLFTEMYRNIIHMHLAIYFNFIIIYKFHLYISNDRLKAYLKYDKRERQKWQVVFDITISLQYPRKLVTFSKYVATKMIREKYIVYTGKN